jgi:hypothetical protein
MLQSELVTIWCCARWPLFVNREATLKEDLPAVMPVCALMTTHSSLALDSELGASETSALDAHLAQCPPCRGRFARMKAADALLRGLANRLAAAVASHADDLPHRVMARLRGSAAPADDMHGFMRLVIQDKSLQDQIGAAAATRTPPAMAAALVQLGSQHGYAFAQEQVLNLLARRPASNDELTEEELRAVVAGVALIETQFLALFPTNNDT